MLLGVALLAFLTWQVVSNGWVVDLDQASLRRAVRLDMHDYEFFKTTVRLGSRYYIRLISVPILVIVSWRRRSWIPILGFFLVFFMESAIVAGLKYAVNREYPYAPWVDTDTPRTAFPSGHTTNVVALWGYMGWYFTRGNQVLRAVARRVVVAMAIVTSLSSWIIFTHWPSDLVAGMVIGHISLMTVVCAIRAYEAERSPSRQLVSQS